MRGEILRRSGLKQKDQNNQGRKQEGSEANGREKAKEVWIYTLCKDIETCLVKKQNKKKTQKKQESILAGVGSNLRDLRSPTNEDRSRKCLTEDSQQMDRILHSNIQP